MTRLNVSKPVAVAVALFTCFFLNSNRAGAVIFNALLNVPWSSNTGIINISGSANPTLALTYTDGNTATYDYNLGPIIYDLGSITPAIQAVGVAIGPGRPVPEYVVVSFSDNNFSTTLATDTVPLANQTTIQQVSIPSLAAEYVQFAFPTTSAPGNFYPSGGDGFTTPAELQLLALAPEPASFGLLGIGGLMLLRRQRLGRHGL